MKLSKKLVLTAFCTLVVTFLLAQGAPPATPIDGGLTALLAAGGLYGAKKLYDGKVRK